MTDEEFIKGVRAHVLDAAVRDVLGGLERPPGRRPAAEALARRDWYAGLDDEARANIAFVARDAAHAALFGLFATLDGVRLIHDDLRDGRLRLVYDAGGEETVLSDNQAGSDLHDLLNARDL